MDQPTHDKESPRPLTPMENVILTAKVLAGAGVFVAVIWGLERWVNG